MEVKQLALLFEEKDEESIGEIIGEVTTQNIEFVTDKDIAPARLDYVVIPNYHERKEKGAVKVPVLAQVTELLSESSILQKPIGFEAARRIREQYSFPTRIYGQAKILGYVDPDDPRKIRIPRSTALPGQPIYHASNDQLTNFFTFNLGELGVTVGTLINRSGVPVELHPNQFQRHLAIIGQTGAGKSNLTGLIIEQLHRLGATIIVFDPNSDYVRARFLSDGQPNLLADWINVFRIPGASSRFEKSQTGDVEEFAFKYASLSGDHKASLVGVSRSMVKIRQALNCAFDRARATKPNYLPGDVWAALEQMEVDMEEKPKKPDLKDISAKNIADAKVRYERMLSQQIWKPTGIDFDGLLKPQTLSVVDLAGSARQQIDITVSITLRNLWSLAMSGDLKYPLFLFLEEAHNLIPRPQSRSGEDSDEGELSSAYWIRRIAAEGRKYGIYLVLVTQRPNKIHQDALSMCNSQIIMRLTNTSDQNAVADASEALSRELLNDLPGLNVGEAIVLGPIVRRPAIVNITQRATAEGGADRDVMAALERAIKAAKGVQNLKPSSTTMKKAEPSSPIKVVRPTQGDKK